jgi:hypothetical protein
VSCVSEFVSAENTGVSVVLGTECLRCDRRAVGLFVDVVCLDPDPSSKLAWRSSCEGDNGVNINWSLFGWCGRTCGGEVWIEGPEWASVLVRVVLGDGCVGGADDDDDDETEVCECVVGERDRIEGDDDDAVEVDGREWG